MHERASRIAVAAVALAMALVTPADVFMRGELIGMSADDGDGQAVAEAFALPSGYRVEFLTTNRGAERGTSRLTALDVDATPLRFMDFLLRDAIDAAALHDDGVLVRIPQPARYAVHKLMISRRRRPGTGKDAKDAMQAATLIEILSRKDPFALRDAYAEARDRGPEWRKLLDEAVSLLPGPARSALTA